MHERLSDVDVLVAGGGSAGVGAALGAAAAGARTVLVEKAAFLGGAATLRNVVTYCGLFTRHDSRQVVWGVAGEVLDRLRQRHAVSEPTTFTAVSVVFDPEQLKVVLDELTAEAGIEHRFHSLLVDAKGEGSEVKSVTVADHGGLHTIHANAFVDATGDADLASLAGAQVRYGNGGRIQNASLGVRLGGIPSHVRLDREDLRTAVERARDHGASGLSSSTGLVARMPVSGDIISYLVDAEYDVRDVTSTSTAEVDARAAAQRYLDVIRTIPGCEDAYVVTTGPELGTRESRHIVAPRLLTEAEVITPRALDDAIAVGAWPIEYHPGPGLPSEWKHIEAPGFYGVPLDSLRSVTFDNLFAAGRVMDADRGAGASLRVMGTAFATGQAAGVAAALVARGQLATSAVVRAELDRQGAPLPRVQLA